MSLPYKQALSIVQVNISAYNANLYGPNAERDPEVRAFMRERRDYWHVLGSRIRRRMEREARRATNSQ